MSTKTRLDILEVPPSLSFDWETIKANYDVVINDDNFLTLILNSILVTGLSTLLALLIGVPAAYAFSRLRFRGREQWSTTILSFRFMPPVAVAIPIFLMMREIGMVVSFHRPDPALHRVLAAADGVDHDRLLRRDPAPNSTTPRWSTARRGSAPSCACCCRSPGRAWCSPRICGVIFIWNEFLVGLYVITSPRQADRTDRRLGAADDAEPIDWNIAAGVGVLTTIPILIFSIFVQRYIVRGMTAGAIR